MLGAERTVLSSERKMVKAMAGEQLQTMGGGTQHSGLSTSRVLEVVPLAGIFLLNFFMSTDPDLWWHMAAGRFILDTGSVPQTDPFSFTAAGQPWVAHEWLAEIAIYLIYRAGGYLAPVIVFASLVAAAFWVVFRTVRLLGMGVPGAACITFWAAFMSMGAWNVRPQVFSYLFFAVYLFLLVRSRQRRDRWIWAIPTIMVLWVNLHAGYVMGLLILGMFVVGEAINLLRVGRSLPPGAQAAGRNLGRGLVPRLRFLSTPLSAPGTGFRMWVGVAAATLVATAANPQGLSILLYPLTYAGTQNASMRYITEWQSPNFHDYFFFVFGASMMLLMVLPGRRAVDWAVGVPLLVLTAMSLQSARVIPFYALAVAPFLALRLAKPSAVGTQHSRPSPARRLNWALLALCIAVLGSTLFISDRAQLGPQPRTVGYPAEGVRYIQQSGLTGRLFNTYHWGGFVVWSFYPERRAFIDGRADLYGDGFVEEYMKAYNGRPGWKTLLERERVGVALVESDAPIAALLAESPDWEQRFQGKLETVFVRKTQGVDSPASDGSSR
jgi:hypothetical protein